MQIKFCGLQANNQSDICLPLPIGDAHDPPDSHHTRQLDAGVPPFHLPSAVLRRHPPAHPRTHLCVPHRVLSPELTLGVAHCHRVTIRGVFIANGKL